MKILVVFDDVTVLRFSLCSVKGQEWIQSEEEQQGAMGELRVFYNLTDGARKGGGGK